MSEPSKRTRWALWLPLALFAGFVALVFVGLYRPASHDVVSAMVGKPLPQFALRAAVAERPGVSSGDFAAGKPRLLNIFASWCIPCAAEAPQLAMLAAQGVAIDGIAIRDQRADLEQFLALHGNPYARIGADDVREVQLAIGSSGVPETFVIDGKGVIRYQHIGEIRAEHMAMLLQKLREAGQ
jgi:cytochrome c biogenesis protein CcmG/thiol:disulfide interchange protein DsbE